MTGLTGHQILNSSDLAGSGVGAHLPAGSRGINLAGGCVASYPEFMLLRDNPLALIPLTRPKGPPRKLDHGVLSGIGHVYNIRKELVTRSASLLAGWLTDSLCV